jgi:hypothetical protein
MKGVSFVKTKPGKAALYSVVLVLVMATGCSSLQKDTSSRSWTQTATREEDEQQFNASPQSDGEFYPFGAP